MAALQFVDFPDYAALLLRRTYPELSLPNSLMDRAAQWLRGTAARWSHEHRHWRFPSGATLGFGYLDTATDMHRYRSAEYQYVGFDELTTFEEGWYRFLFSRQRRAAGSWLPVRMRAASNPGGVGHAWVRRRFLDAAATGRLFFPARLADNPYVDAAEYAAALANLDPVERARILNGDWEVRDAGSKFRREWFEVVAPAAVPARARQLAVRYWDLAATDIAAVRRGRARDPDYTAGALVGLWDGVWYVLDLAHRRASPAGVEALIRQTATLDTARVTVYIEQEPGASGKTVIDTYQRRVLAGWPVYGVSHSGNKDTRLNPLASAAEAGNVKLVDGPWVAAFLDEADAYPGGHDDQIDALAGAMEQIARQWGGGAAASPATVARMTTTAPGRRRIADMSV